MRLSVKWCIHIRRLGISASWQQRRCNTTKSKTYGIQGAGSDVSVDMVASSGHRLRTDLPKAMGGNDSAPQPVELLLGALLGCTQATALFVARHIYRQDDKQIHSIEYDVRAMRDPRGAIALPKPPSTIPSRIQQVSGTITVVTPVGQPLSDDMLAAIREETELRCPVANMMLASGCRLQVEWKQVSEDKATRTNI